MKQVVFAVLLMAMASLTGCLNGDDSPVDENIDTTDDSTSDTTEDNSDTTDDTKEDELIEPVGTDGGYTPPENSDISVDYGYSGYWVETAINSNEFEWVACTKQGYSIIIEDSTRYCDLDERQDVGAQTWVNKTGNTVTVECIKYKGQQEEHSCKDMYTSTGKFYHGGVHIAFTSVEGFQEVAYVTLAETYRTWNDDTSDFEFNHKFFKTEIELQFEPVSFTISKYHSTPYDDWGTYDSYSYAGSNSAALSTSSVDNRFSLGHSSTRYF